MKVYHPQISVKLVKARDRKEIAPGLPVAQKRYASLDAIDLTPYLGNAGSVSVTKSVRQPTGGFTLTFPDQMHKTLQESLYALIEPMDLIEIRMAHGSGRPPVMMRGLVSDIERQETMMDRGPMRVVTVRGHDLAKILQTLQIHYLPFTQASANVMQEMRFFFEYAKGSSIKTKSASDFIADILSGMINPYLKKLTQLSDGSSVSAKIINEWTASVSVAGSISPYTLNSFIDVSLYEVLRVCLDVGAFNELYVEDTDDGARLVVRPIPFKTVSGEFIQGDAVSMRVDAVDINELTVSRSDEGVANYFWVYNNRWVMMHDQAIKSAAYLGNPEQFVIENYINSEQKFFGWRKMEVSTVLGDPSYSYSDKLSAKHMPDETMKLSSWLDGRRKLLTQLNQDNLVYESGLMHLRGNEAIKPGMYLTVFRGPGGRVGECYAHTVTHQFSPFQGFFTFAQFDRGTFFIERSRFPASPYIPEIEAQGVR